MAVSTKKRNISKSNKISSSRKKLIKSRKSKTKTRKMKGGVLPQLNNVNDLPSDFSELNEVRSRSKKELTNFYDVILSRESNNTHFTIKGITMKLYRPILQHPGYYNEDNRWITNKTIPYENNNNKREYGINFVETEQHLKAYVLGRGKYKIGYKVEIKNNEELGLPKYGALTNFIRQDGKKYLDKIIPLQKIAAENNLATMPYTYDCIPFYGCFILMDLVNGRNLRKFNTTELLTDDIQIEIFKAYLKLVNLNIMVPDDNCENIFIDKKDDKIKITFIDDFIEGDGAKNKLNNVISTLLELNSLQFQIIDCNIKKYVTHFFTINNINIKIYPPIYPDDLDKNIKYPIEPINFCDIINDIIKTYLD